MRSQSQNNSIREHHKFMSQHHLHQKNAFKKLYDSGIDIDYRDPKIIKLICQGVPSMYRPRVWPLLIQNVHGITSKFYQILIKKAAIHLSADPSHVIPQRSKMITHLNRIQQDIQRTYPQLKLFRKDNEQGQALFNILAAWTAFRQDVGYIQGMSQIAGLLLIELKEIQAFEIFCSVMTTDVLFIYQNLEVQDMQFFQHNFLKRLKRGDQKFYFQMNGTQVRNFILTWILTLFTRVMSLDMVSLLWDILFVYNLCPDILIQACYFITISAKNRISPEAQPQQICQVLKKLKLNDIEAMNVMTKIKQNFRSVMNIK